MVVGVVLHPVWHVVTQDPADVTTGTKSQISGLPDTGKLRVGKLVVGE